MIWLGDPKSLVRDVKRFAQALAHHSGVRSGELSTRPPRVVFRETIWVMGEERPRIFRQTTGSTKEGECAVPNSHSPSFFCSRSRPGERIHRGAGGIDWSGKDSHQHRDQSLGPADRTILENRLGVVGQAAAGGSVRPSRMFVHTGVRLRWTAGEMWLAGEWLNRWSVSSFSQNSSAGRTPPADSSR
jgi:hypothetical protein